MPSDSVLLNDTLRVARRLEEAIESKATVLVLDQLKALDSAPMTMEILQKTKVGMTVAKLKTYDATDVVAASQAIVKKWKELAASAGKAPVVTPAMRKLAEDRKVVSPPPAKSPAPTKAPIVAVKDRISGLFVKAVREQVGFLTDADRVRIKALTAAIDAREEGTPSNPAEDAELTMLLQKQSEADVVERANEVANQLDQIFLDKSKDAPKPSAAYADHFRAIMLNLPHNLPLVVNVFNEAVSVEQLANMPVEEMVSESMKSSMLEMSKRSAEAAMSDWASRNRGKQMQSMGLGETVGTLICKNCRSRNTEYSERQTRSADEPTTKFAYCHDCAARWKFC